MLLKNASILKFSEAYPITNWFYPVPETGTLTDLTAPEVFAKSVSVLPKRRALYFHIPFCDTICTFCPFTRGQFKSQDIVDRYVEALIKEIELKGQMEVVKATPAETIYFGGGTPSVLQAEHILAIGEAMHKHLDLSQIKEFTFECEAKSVTAEKVEAMKKIGVNRASFGVQTFTPSYREAFNLTASLEQIKACADLLNANFNTTNCDIIYGIHGQSIADLTENMEKAIELGVTTIDFYPLNNLASQLRLHKTFERDGLKPMSGLEKINHRMLVNEYMRHRGFAPHNGYSFVRLANPESAARVTYTEEYTFRYHEVMYGYEDEDAIGFGAGALTMSNGFGIYNEDNRGKYINALMTDGQLPIKAYQLPDAPERGLVGALSYLGKAEKSRIRMDEVSDDIKARLQELIDADLVHETETELSLTESGWLWFANVMYYLASEVTRDALDGFTKQKLEEKGREDGVYKISMVS